MRIGVMEIKSRTYKVRDSWWTVLFVDPVAVRLVWLIAPYRWATPNRITAVSFGLGTGAAVAFYTHRLILGAILFHLSFLLDCMDGKVARLHGNGTFAGAWLEFVLDRVRFVLVAGGLFAGQYLLTGQPVYLWAGALVVLLDLLHYVSGAEIRQVSVLMAASVGPGESLADWVEQTPSVRRFRTWATALQRRRIRPRLFGGVEFEQFVCVLAPLAGAVLAVTAIAVGLQLVFEAAVIVLLVRASRRTARLLRTS